jgi:hypothetical protein
MAWALIPAGLWVAAMIVIGQTVGFHSLAGICGEVVGFPGDLLGFWIGDRTVSLSAVYVGSFLGIWFFWFGLFIGAKSFKHLLTRRRTADE